VVADWLNTRAKDRLTYESIHQVKLVKLKLVCNQLILVVNINKNEKTTAVFHHSQSWGIDSRPLSTSP